jgi:PhnB protein
MASMAQKTTRVQPIPEGFDTATPYLIVSNATDAIEFYKKAFGATERFRMTRPDGRVGHAEIQIGDSRLLLADEHSDIGARSPQHYGGSPITILLYVENVDAVFAQAVAAGARVDRPVQDQPYGDRNGGVVDPFGHRCFLAPHIKDMPQPERKP